MRLVTRQDILVKRARWLNEVQSIISLSHTQFYVYIYVHKAIIYFGKIYWVAGSTSFRDQKGCLDVSHHLLQTLWGMLAPTPPISTIDQSAGHSPQQCGCVILYHKPHLEDSSNNDILCSVSGKAETLRADRIGPGLKQDFFSFSPISQGLLRSLGVTGGPILDSFLLLLYHHLLAQGFTPFSLLKFSKCDTLPCQCARR